MEITKVRVRHADRSIWGHLAEREKTLPLVTPLDIYADFQETRGSWFWESGMALVEIETDEGIIGRGWCEDGCRAVAPVIENHLVRLLTGQNPFEVEGIYDRLYRSTLPYGRKGIALQAISAIDIALWDIAGKATAKPVFELLGGPVRKRVPVYASALHPVGRQPVQEEAKTYVEQGFSGMKCRFPYGPGNGVQGMAANEAHIACIRETVGDDIELMADAYMGWDFNYARKCAVAWNSTTWHGLRRLLFRMTSTVTPDSDRKRQFQSPAANTNTHATVFSKSSANAPWTLSSRTCVAAVALQKLAKSRRWHRQPASR